MREHEENCGATAAAVPLGQTRRPEREHMNFAELSTGTKVLLISGLLLLIDSFLAWQEVSADLGTGSVTLGSVNMWHGIGVLAGLLIIALLVWEGLQVAGVTNGWQLPVSAAVISVGLAAATALFVVIKFLVANEFRHWPAWIGLILAIVVAVGGWLKYSESESAEASPTPSAPPA